jgi:hypothetical protein
LDLGLPFDGELFLTTHFNGDGENIPFLAINFAGVGEDVPLTGEPKSNCLETTGEPELPAALCFAKGVLAGGERKFNCLG